MPDLEKVQDKTDNVQEVTFEWKDRQEWEARKSLQMRREYEDLFTIWKQTELSELDKKNEEIIQKGLDAYVEKLKEEQKPPTDEDLEKLLNQEYKEFRLKVDYVDGDDFKSEVFTIRELPQSSEKRFFKHFKEKILGKSAQLEALMQETVDQPFDKKAKAFMELFDESFDVLAEAVVIVLNPFGKKDFVTRKWVQDNIGSDRQWRMVEAQIEVNRLKDFFSRVSQSGLTMQTTMTGQRFQQLQQLAR